MKRIMLDTIDVSKLENIKSREKWYGTQDHSRWLFLDKKQNLYYKIWNDTYIRKDCVPQAIDSGFYDNDNVPALHALIYWEGICRGYVMKTCEPYKKVSTKFYNLLLDKTIQSKMFAYDFCPNHVYKYKDKLTLIDLEGVYELNQYDDKYQEHISLGIPGRFVEHKPYDDFLQTLLYQPLDKKLFLSMPLQKGRGGKEICLNNYNLKTVNDVINYWKKPENKKSVQEKLNPNNWQYYNCMIAEFRKDVKGHHEMGWENMTEEYYNSLPYMKDNEIKTTLEKNPVSFDVNFIKHSTHRAYAMIGRLINDKPYIPFYVKTKVVDPTSNVRFLNTIKDWPKDEYTIVQSGILSTMGIRQNSDLDVVVSSKLKLMLYDVPDKVEVMVDRKKFQVFGCKSDDDLVYNYSKKINGFNFAQPRFYFSRLWIVNESKAKDQNNIKRFKERLCHETQPFNVFNEEEWGFELLPQ